jgi:hypothetical protein
MGNSDAVVAVMTSTSAAIRHAQADGIAPSMCLPRHNSLSKYYFLRFQCTLCPGLYLITDGFLPRN